MRTVKDWALSHRRFTFLAILVIIAIIVGVWREYSDSKETVNTSVTETVSESSEDEESDKSEDKSEEKQKFSLGWSNIIIFGGLLITLVVVRRKKALGTSDSDRKTKDDSLD
jgi:uncharacterized membrane protein YraQ (UPF0718 family)